jgi:DNA helicase-2/ATP-dependent DNA helicase PcrA
VLEAYRQHIQYILVDEYQDTNPLQYRILRLLAERHRNLFVVGDDAQSIYGFRGADVRNFRYMERDFAPVEIIRLEQNYRSTPQILSLANALLTHSTELYPKKLFTHNPAGPTPYLYTKCLTVSDEAQWVVHKVREELMRHHLRYSDIAILYRTNAYSRAFEEKLRAERIPYKLIGTLSFYQREEIKHFLAFLRFLLNPDDEQALLRILTVRGEGIGEVTIERLREQAAQKNSSLWQVLPEGVRFLRGPSAKALQNFYTYLVRFRESVQALPLAEQVEVALDKSGLFLYYAEDERAAERKENLQSFVASAYEFVERHGYEATLRDFLQNIALISSSDDPKGAPADAVWLSTVHGVKGMEFHTVFLVGVIEGLFPHAYALEEDKAALEEERRIFYVALTRAGRHLYLTCPTLDSRYGASRPATPSRFLQEMGLTEREEVRPALAGTLKPRAMGAKSAPSPVSFAPHELAPPEAIQVGLWVEHTHFGRGRVLEKEENGAAGVVRIRFDTVGIKKLDLRYAKLRIVS